MTLRRSRREFQGAVLGGALAALALSGGPARAQAIKLPTAEMARNAETKADMWKRLPDFPLWNASGQEIRYQDFRGKLTLLHFWGSWCPPCRREMPMLAKFHDAFRDNPDLNLVIVAYGEEYANSRKLLAGTVSDAVLYDPREGGQIGNREKNLYRHLSLRKVPATLISDRNGIVFYWQEDATDWNRLIQQMPAILAQAAPFAGG